MHKVLVIITIAAFICGIVDLALNVAILSKVSGKDPVTAVETMYNRPVKITPTMTLAPVATLSAVPSKFMLQKRILPTVTAKLSPVPSHATIKK